MNKIFITGAYGFIGQSLCQSLISPTNLIRGAVRNIDESLNSKNLTEIEYVSIGDIGLKKNWKEILIDHDCIIHCAAKAHKINETNMNAIEAYRLVNVEGTRRLAEQAAEIGVKRFIFLSSIGVNGTNSNGREAFSIFDNPNPTEDYAISKYEAEQELLEVAAKTGIETVILRIPPVYGKGAKGNFAILLKLLSYGLPLPFNAIHNKRSFIGFDNLISLLTLCINHPDSAGKTFLVSDDEDLSTPDLLRNLALAMGRPSRLFSVPNSLLKLISYFIGRQNEIDRLLGSLQVNISHTRETLNWNPTVSVTEGIRRMVQNK